MEQYISLEKAKEIILNKKVVYLIFSAPWCGDCKMMEPIINQVFQKYIDDKEVAVIIVNPDENDIGFNEAPYYVSEIPTHCFIKNGQIDKILYNYLPFDEIVLIIDKLKND